MVVSLAVALAVGGLAVVQRLVPLSVREGLPSVMWVVLVVGSVITVAFTYLFGLETLWLHILAVAALTVVITLIIYTIALLEYPFNGNVRVGPEAFELVLGRIEGGDR